MKIINPNVKDSKHEKQSKSKSQGEQGRNVQLIFLLYLCTFMERWKFTYSGNEERSKSVLSAVSHVEEPIFIFVFLIDCRHQCSYYINKTKKTSETKFLV